MFEWTKSYRYLYIVLACFQNITLSGIFYGWASISGSLLASGVIDGGPGLSVEYIHVMYVVAQFFNYMGPFFFGMILDFYGPRVCSVLSIASITVGCCMFGLSNQSTRPLFIPAMCLIAFAGPGVQNSIVHLSNLFPDAKASALAYIIGSFSLSFIVLLVFDQLWLFMHLSYQQLFLGYSAICVLNMIISIVLWPDHSYLVIEGDQSPSKAYDMGTVSNKFNQRQNSTTSTSGSIALPTMMMIPRPPQATAKLRIHSEVELINKYPFHAYSAYCSSDDFLNRSTHSEASHDELYELKDSSLHRQIFSFEFFNAAILFVIHSFWINFYMGTFDMQIKDQQIVTDINEEHNFARLFTIINASGIIFIPIVGILMDTTGFPFTAVLITLSGVLWSICLLVSTSYALLLSFLFYSFYRISFFIFIFGYLVDTFGFKYYGLLAGIMFLCGGFIGLLQYPLATYALGTCHNHNNHNNVVIDNNGVDDSMEDDCDQGQWYQVHIVMMIMILSTLYFSYQDQVRRIIIAEHIKSMEMIRNRILANRAINIRADKSSQWR